MKTPRSDSERRWEELLANARADVGPPADVRALLRAVRHAPWTVSQEDWAAEFDAIFSPRRVVPTCLACAVVIASLATWQVWHWWQALPWAQWLVTAGGAA